MRFPTPVTASWIAEFTGARLVGDATQPCAGLNVIQKVQPGELCFVDLPKYYDKCLRSPATLILIDQEVAVPEGKTLLIHPDPFSAFVKLIRHFRPPMPLTAHVSDTAQIGEGTVVSPGAVVGHHVSIGRDCIIHPNVVLYDYTEIGDGVIIHAGAVIGADAFYFKRRKEQALQYDKFDSCGRVVIEDGVEIGACCTIDRGVTGDTVIGAGSKLDNHVHIGHGVVLGRNCLIAAQVGIAGKTILEDEVTLWGQVGVNKDLRIGKGAVVYAQSGVPASIEGGKVYFGSPVLEAREKMKELAIVKRLARGKQ